MGVFLPQRKDEMALMPFDLFALGALCSQPGIIPMLALAGVTNFHHITVVQIAREHSFWTEAVRGMFCS